MPVKLKILIGFLAGAIVSAALIVAGSAVAGTIEMIKDTSTARAYGTKIDALALTSARWTGWIDTADKRSVVFDIDFTDADSSVTAVTMVCETSRVSSTANDSGRDLHVLTIAGSTATSTPLTWSYTTAGTKSWTWIVSNVPAPWLNCKFSATGTPAAADTVTVYARGISP